VGEDPEAQVRDRRTERRVRREGGDGGVRVRARGDDDDEGPDPQGALLLDPERCVGCDACVSACPVKVVSMDDQVTWAELASGTQEAYRPSPDRRPEGSFHR